MNNDSNTVPPTNPIVIALLETIAAPLRAMIREEIRAQESLRAIVREEIENLIEEATRNAIDETLGANGALRDTIREEVNELTSSRRFTNELAEAVADEIDYTDRVREAIENFDFTEEVLKVIADNDDAARESLGIDGDAIASDVMKRIATAIGETR